MPGEDVGDYPTLTGLIIKHNKNGNNWDEVGFAYTIDMDYKDKPDQYSDIAFEFTGSRRDLSTIDEFKELCKQWRIPYVELEE